MGVGDEALGGERGPVAVAARDTGPAEVELAGAAVGYRLETVVEHPSGRHRVGAPDRHRRPDQRVALAEGGVDRRLGRAVRVEHPPAMTPARDDSAFAEDHVFRIDHYLGKETVQNLLALRFANMLFEPLWNAQAIDHVQITVAETVGLEGRVSYYDGVGALRDMVQNHMLQLLAIIAMEPPASVSSTAVRDEKVKLLRSLRKMSSEDVKAHSVKGQYNSGAVNGGPVAGYAEELGEPSNTETFVAIKAYIDNWRWKGVPFYLRTGKRMPQRKSEVLIQFKPVPHNIFARVGAGRLDANMMVINLQPEENIRVKVMAKQPGLDREGVKLKDVTLDVSLSHSFAGERRRIAYERLLLDFIEGDQTLFVRRDEVEAQWQWIDSIRDAWGKVEMAPQNYTAGSWGPSAAIALIERDGASWHD